MADNYKELIDSLVEENNHEALLKEILAIIHQDGGHYTTLCGLSCSFLDAKVKVFELFRQNRELKDYVRRNKKKDQ